MNSNLAIIKRAAEIRQESAPGAVLVPFEETTTAQKVWPIGKAWAEHHGWRPPARVIETVEELDSLPDDAAIRDRNGKAWGAKRDGVPSESLRSLLPVTVLFEGGTA